MVWSLSSLIIGLIVGGLIGWAMAAARNGKEGSQHSARYRANSAFSSETGTIGETDPAQVYGKDPGKLAASSALVFVKNKQHDICGCDTTQMAHQQKHQQQQHPEQSDQDLQ